MSEHTVVGRADKLGLLSEGELRNTLIPTSDNSTDTDGGDERLSSVSRRVELGAVGGQSTDVYVRESVSAWIIRGPSGSMFGGKSGLQCMVTVSPFLGKF